MEIVRKRMHYVKGGPKDTQQTPFEDENLNLMNTIKLPRNLTQLTDRLPKPNYLDHHSDDGVSGRATHKKDRLGED